jgi:hypothetical protein
VDAGRVRTAITSFPVTALPAASVSALTIVWDSHIEIDEVSDCRHLSKTYGDAQEKVAG